MDLLLAATLVFAGKAGEEQVTTLPDVCKEYGT